MLYSKNRLAKRADIERVFKKGRSFFVGNLGIRLAKNSLKVSRFTVVVSTKVSKKAVERNKLKRRMREIIRKEILPNTKPGFDGVISTKKPLLDSSFDDLRTLAIKLFKKARLI
ncbi:ribonuclease P protein component [bacterium]|jgi:ribonuclease P protein component|nr:ribonuclease P protein component [bacterium]MDP6571366.1 ribonuclease P protein component [Patescibacteria group bacterium]|tara:strand:+ start:5272 stop:5613 length:342 start_codon:yes stop_codon:yes gene_type:complete